MNFWRTFMLFALTAKIIKKIQYKNSPKYGIKPFGNNLQKDPIS